MVNLNDLSTWQLVTSFFKTKRIIGIVQVEIDVLTYTTHLLFQASNNLVVSSDFDTLRLQLGHKLVSYILTGNI